MIIQYELNKYSNMYFLSNDYSTIRKDLYVNEQLFSFKLNETGEVEEIMNKKAKLTAQTRTNGVVY